MHMLYGCLNEYVPFIELYFLKIGCIKSFFILSMHIKRRKALNREIFTVLTIRCPFLTTVDNTYYHNYSQRWQGDFKCYKSITK